MRLVVFLTLAVFGSAVANVEYYTDAYDNTNVDAIMRSNRLFKIYLDCLLEKGSCTSDGRAFRTILPEAMSTNCAKCSQVQKQIARQIGRYLVDKRPEAWAQLTKKYDPDNVYIEAFEKFIAEEE